MSSKQVIYNVGIYLRLSKDDGDDVESESITNQRKIINEYVTNSGNMNIYDEYIDDGYSGANFNRPDFKRLLADIENKKINMVITKNLARLGRNYIETGSYIEKYFPDHRVRYIAILDNVDNFKESVSNDFVPIKSVLNEKHCRDTSIAVKRTKRKKMTEGFYACTTAPFGYKKDPDNPGKLIIDEVSSKTVKKIFELKESGYTIDQIVRYLGDNNYPTPAEYMKIRGLERVENKNVWKRSSVTKILSNKVYLGHCLRGKTQNISYKSKDRIYVRREDLTITLNTHEAIISEETFNNVHSTKKYGSTKKIQQTEYLFKDLIYCKNCSKKLNFKKRRNKVDIYCRYNSENTELCSNNCRLEYYNIEDKVFDYITNMYKDYYKNKMKDNLYKRFSQNKMKDLDYENKELKQTLDKLNFKIASLYNQRLLEKIDEEEYKVRYTALSNQRKELEKQIENRENEVNNEKAKIDSLKQKNKVMKKLQNIDKKDFNNINIKEIIERIEVYKNEVNIRFNFSEDAKFNI